MRIRQVLIVGFKSYRSLETFDPFTPQVNVLVGKNGSGKSNIISAIRFVLGDQFHAKLRMEERKALLHQGATEKLLSGYVEVRFDNSERRLPVDSNEVSIKRTIGLKQSECYLNGKHVSSEEIYSIFEAAGISRSNPYYIVQQGKVQSLCRMKASERLELLYEIAGTKVYDEKRTESKRILQESDDRRQKVQDVLEVLTERLNDLEKEREELKEYQDIDKVRRTIEYCINKAELNDVIKKLELLEESHTSDMDVISNLHDSIQKMSDEYKQLDIEKNREKELADRLQVEYDSISDEMIKEEQLKAHLGLRISQISGSLQGDSTAARSYQQELVEVRDSVRQAESELNRLLPRFQDVQRQEREIIEQINQKEARYLELLSKQGGIQFTSKEDRDSWLKKEIKSIADTIKQKKGQDKALKKEIENLHQEIERTEELLAEREQVERDFKQRLEEQRSSSLNLIEKRDSLTSRRKELWKNQSNLKNQIVQISNEVSRHWNALYLTLPYEMSKGVQAVERIKKERNMGGIFGPVIELFEFTSTEMLPIDVAAKTQLFNIVVDTDATASKLLTILNAEKAGRVTVMPLNLLNPKEVVFPRTETSVPLIDRLRFKTSHRKAFLQIFGRILLCSNLEEAQALSRTHRMDCITLEGDLVSRSGSFSGGYHDKSKIRLDHIQKIKNATEKSSELEEELKQIEAELETVESALVKILEKYQQAEKEISKESSQFEIWSQNVSKSQQRLFQLKSMSLEKEHLSSDITSSLEHLNNLSSSLKAQLGKPLHTSLSNNEKREMNTLSREIDELKNDLSETTQIRTQLESQKKQQEMKLGNYLLMKQSDLERGITSIEIKGESNNLLSLQKQLESVEKQIREIQKKRQELQARITSSNQHLREITKAQDDLNEKKLDSSKQFEAGAQTLERLLSSRTTLMKKKETINSKLKSIGTLPSEEFKKYQTKSVSELINLLTKYKKRLKKYSHVNKKAFDQYLNFKEQKEALEARNNELEQSHSAITQLIQVLDTEKASAIKRTCKMTAKNFSDVFAQLTNGEGTAQLVMQSRPDSEELDEIDRYTGIEIKVSFTRTGKVQRMHQLSGGQQSLVALALIFAIQRCDPAPFYIFDEIDAALDDHFRAAVASIIESRSVDTQFIITTHRPEMVNIANKLYLITYANKESHLATCTHEEALQLLGVAAEEEREEEEESEIRGAITDPLRIEREESGEESISE